MSPRWTFAPAAAHCRGGLLGASEAKHLVAGVKQLTDDGGTNESGRAGFEYTHGRTSYRSGSSSIGG